MVLVCWETKAALAAFWPVAQQLRVRISERAGVETGAMEDLTVIRTTVRLG